MSDLKVVHLLKAPFLNGAERMLASAAEDLKKEGMKGIILGLRKDHALHSVLVVSGYQANVTPNSWFLAWGLSFAQILRSERTGVVHIHVESSFLLAALTSFLAGRELTVRTVYNWFRSAGRVPLRPIWSPVRMLGSLSIFTVPSAKASVWTMNLSLA